MAVRYVGTAATVTTPWVFLCYRRSDSAFAVKALRSALEDALGDGAVFLDDVDMPHGYDYRASAIASIASIEAVETVIVVIGPGWSTELLGDHDDDVRMEIAAALRTGRFLLPVFVDRDGPPAPELVPEDIRDVVFRHGLPLRADRLDPDFAAIAAAVSKASPATLSIVFDPPGFLLGNLIIELDHATVFEGPMRKGAIVRDLHARVGAHVLSVNYGMLNVGERRTWSSLSPRGRTSSACRTDMQAASGASPCRSGSGERRGPVADIAAASRTAMSTVSGICPVVANGAARGRPVGLPGVSWPGA